MSLAENAEIISGYDALHEKRTFEVRSYAMIAITFAVLNLIPVSCATQTSAPKVTQRLPTNFKTKFIKDAELSVAEMNQVVALAFQCGIPDVERIETFRYLPGPVRGIAVKTKERRSGRSVTYDTVYLGRNGWNSTAPDAKAKRLGAFWVNEPYLNTYLLREFKIGNKAVRVNIGESVDIVLADKVIPSVVAGKVQFENDWVRGEFQGLDLSEPASIDKSWNGDGYELRYDKPIMKGLLFKVENGDILITGVTTISI